ncbi:hypothetical protein CEV32_4836 [Brucella rhizosphaerae]|uniref:Uncharacterized protein n=1 Tax=Brucella rhizosphaerae TaxID=571254 RepID=A0A256FLC5_9HYPH|nr:hypothetical protein CEV32_4836 [Brucella rhizosphaerae]
MYSVIMAMFSKYKIKPMTNGLGFLNNRQQFVSERLKVLTSRAAK